jgi:hypothetical protein
MKITKCVFCGQDFEDWPSDQPARDGYSLDKYPYHLGIISAIINR